VEMPPPAEHHGVVSSWIAHLLWMYVIQHGKGYVCGNDTGLLVEREPDTLRGPDVMLFDEARPLDRMSRKFTERIPKLVVEVLSPSDSMSKVNVRIGQFLRRGVPLVWIVDAELRIVSVYRSGKDLYTLEEGDEVTGEDVLPAFRLRVAELFTL